MPSFARLILVLLLSAGTAACSTVPPAQAPVALSNPVFVPARGDELVWERAVDVLHSYSFEIARENRLDGVIETRFKVGSGCLEPWHEESVGFENRAESTLQSIRRRAHVSITPADGGYLIGIEAFKEIEDLPGLAANSAGGATFQESTPLQRDLNLVVGQSTASGWIPLGRDPALEQDMLRRMQAAFGR